MKDDRDHPRIRGEHAYKLEKIEKVLRITPAYAGNTTGQATIGVVIPDHLRICGEHSNNQAGYDGKLGSPPHTRGTHEDVAEAYGASGITPAYAGNTKILRHLANNL